MRESRKIFSERVRSEIESSRFGILKYEWRGLYLWLDVGAKRKIYVGQINDLINCAKLKIKRVVH